MLLVLQHPFADLRRFLAEGSPEVPRPKWPLADADVDYLRSSGIVRDRQRGGLDDWTTEHHYVDAWRALRFRSGMGRSRFGAGLRIPYVFRRFHSNGVVARLDVGLEVRAADDEADAAPVLATAADLLVNVGRERLPTKLIESGPLLASHFLQATTRRAEAGNAPRWWFGAGAPAIVIEHAVGELQLPAQARELITVDGARLAHMAIKFGKLRCNVWFLQKAVNSADATRRIRMHLSCLHAECQSLRLLLKALDDRGKLLIERGAPAAERVELFLLEMIKTVEKPQRLGQAQNPLLLAAREALASINPGELTALSAMRKNTRERVKAYIAASQRLHVTSIHIETLMDYRHNSGIISTGAGDVNGIVVNGTARDIVQNLRNERPGDEPDDLRQALDALAEQVDALIPQLPAGVEQERVARSFQTLTQEALSENPDRRWYEVSGQGLIEAAQKVAELAPTMAQAVKTVLGLLA